jgi:EmrB/QacA subfamily drug resistance transporter
MEPVMTTATAQQANPATSSSVHSGWVLGIAAGASLMVALDAMIVSTAMTAIGRDLGSGVETMQWTLNGYALSFAVLLMSAAALGDRFGRRTIFVAGLVVFAFSSALCALAQGIGGLIAARVAQGAGAAMIMPSALALIGAAFAPERRAWALGIFSAVTALSTILGPALGGVITQSLGWQWVFGINVPIALLLIPLCYARLRESKGNQAPLDIPGAVLVTIAAFGLEWGLVRAAEAGWRSAEVGVSLAGGALFSLAFVVWQTRARHPMIPLSLFRSRAFSAGIVTIFLMFAVLMSGIFFSAQYVQTSFGFGPRDAGLGILPWGIVVTVLAPLSGRFGARFGERNAIVAALLLQALGLVAFAYQIMAGASYNGVVAPMIAAGAGFSLAVPAVQKIIMGAVGLSELGKASGTLSMARQLGGAFGLAVTVAAFALWRGADVTPSAAGFAAAFALAALLSVAAALSATLLRGAVALQRSGEGQRG